MKNTILQGDCISVMGSIPDESIDLVVTSPPYNLGIDYNSVTDKMDFSDYYDWCEKWLVEIYRVLKNDGRLCLNHYFSYGQSDNRQAPLMELNYISQKIGFKHHGVALWNDKTLTKRTAWGSWKSASAPYVNSPFEGILILYKNNWKKFNKGESTISDKEFVEACSGVWNLKPETHKKYNHPAPFPISLPLRCINLLTYKGDLVLDPFMGSGTTAIACIETERNYIGIEKDLTFYNLINKRINDYKSQTNLFK